MAEDALDPGPNGDYPHWPRKPDGSWDEDRMPTGVHREPKPAGDVDLTPRHGPESDTPGEPIVPPGLTPPD